MTKQERERVRAIRKHWVDNVPRNELGNHEVGAVASTLFLLDLVERQDKVIRLASEEAYQAEIVESGMEELEIGEEKEYYDKDEWININIDRQFDEVKFNEVN